MIRDNLGGNVGGVLDTMEEIEANTESGKAAGALAVKELNDSLTVPEDGVKYYADKKDGKYGVNTDPSRGADTFIPFKSGIKLPYNLDFWRVGYLSFKSSTIHSTAVPLDLTDAQKITFGVYSGTTGLYPFYCGVCETIPTSKDEFVNSVTTQISKTKVSVEVDVSNLIGEYYICFYYEINSTGYTATLENATIN